MKKIWIWLLLSLGIAGFLSYFASSYPDGFEKAGEETGFIKGATSFFSSLFPDYTVPGVPAWISTGLAGMIGVLLTFGLFLLLGFFLRKKPHS
ncbi:conserved exported hypothetical protein [[Clostridium] ultunense Esp]|uniref:PDGLE domain-containing protein n=1 Tax=Thermicanus aegyptius TaxID=94009 RepID=UPI0002B70B8A|nr:PDGLE domain-containing protein [Thermicanus aegyptius]CCQ96318.1 conserved exported hypothetical protein [[Clostridium] ultunense Esp]